jgi:hypothetical protein
MIILNKGDRLFPIMGYGDLRVYSSKPDTGPFSGGRPPVILQDRIGVWQLDKAPLGMSLSVLNELLSQTELKNTVLTHEYIHQDGVELQGKKINEVASQVAQALKDKIGFDYFLDFIDLKPVIVVLLRPLALETR